MEKVFNIFFVGGLLGGLTGCNSQKEESLNQTRPNIILVMADDLGYGDLGCYDNNVVKTPALDSMAAEGIKFTRFYAAAPVSSPTRGSCLTGRHPFRLNIPWAGDGFLPREELTIAEVLKEAGYATGHFGKWHVGSLSKTIKQSYFPGDVNSDHYSPPWENGFDECFTTESMVPTYNPYYMVGPDYFDKEYRHIQTEPVEKGQRTKGFRWRDFYWTGEGQIVDEWLEGDDSKLIMDKALDFIDRKKDENQPFLSLIWFHTPHTPVVAGNEHRALYESLSMEEQHCYGAITAMDEQIGRLRQYLKEEKLDENTIVWFCSDNGPSYVNKVTSAGELRGEKATLYEGGIRVPSILTWPAKFDAPFVYSGLSCTTDFYPSILEACGIEPPENQPILDGCSIWSALSNYTIGKDRSIYFQSPKPGKASASIKDQEKQFAVIQHQYKLLSVDNGKTYQLYDLKFDVKEEKDISSENPILVEDMKKNLASWVESCERSARGEDYN